MQAHKLLSVSVSLTLAAVLALTMFAACNVDVDKGAGGKDKKVDIQTPFGGMHISKEADVRDIGLAVYPGARIKPSEEDSGSDKSANVSINSEMFGLKVVAIEYVSDEAPEKIIAFYKDQLKKYGSVLECHTSKHGGDVNVDAGKHKDKDDSHDLKCEGDNSGKVLELKVGTEENQHIVAIEPRGSGTDFSMVYVRTRGKDTI